MAHVEAMAQAGDVFDATEMAKLMIAAPDLLRELKTLGPQRIGVRNFKKLLQWRLGQKKEAMPEKCAATEQNRPQLVALWQQHAPDDLDAAIRAAEQVIADAAASTADAGAAGAAAEADDEDEEDDDDGDGEPEEGAADARAGAADDDGAQDGCDDDEAMAEDDDEEEEEEEEEASGGAGGNDGGGSGAMDVDGASQHANARLPARARARTKRFREDPDDEQPPAGRRAGRVKPVTEAGAQGAAASKRRRRR